MLKKILVIFVLNYLMKQCLGVIYTYEDVELRRIFPNEFPQDTLRKTRFTEPEHLGRYLELENYYKNPKEQVNTHFEELACYLQNDKKVCSVDPERYSPEEDLYYMSKNVESHTDRRRVYCFMLLCFTEDELDRLMLEIFLMALDCEQKHDIPDGKIRSWPMDIIDVISALHISSLPQHDNITETEKWRKFSIRHFLYVCYAITRPIAKKGWLRIQDGPKHLGRYLELENYYKNPKEQVNTHFEELACYLQNDKKVCRCPVAEVSVFEVDEWRDNYEIESTLIFLILRNT